MLQAQKYLSNVFPSKNAKKLNYLFRDMQGNATIEERDVRLFSDVRVEPGEPYRSDRTMPSFYFFEPTPVRREWATSTMEWSKWKKDTRNERPGGWRSQTGMPPNIAALVQTKTRLGDAHPDNPDGGSMEFVPVVDCCFDIETTGLDPQAEDAMVLTICAQLTVVFGDGTKRVRERAVYQLGAVDWSFPMMRAHADKAEKEGVRLLQRDFPCNARSQQSVWAAEREMLEEFGRLVRGWDPDSLTGHNVERFDLPYVLARMEAHGLEMSWGRDGRACTLLRSGAFVVPNRMVVDTSVEARGIEVKGTLHLKSLGTEFLGETKEDMDYREIVPCFRGTEQTRARLASYCLQDAVLPVELALKWNTFPGKFAVARMTFSTLGYPVMAAIYATYSFYALHGGLTETEQQAWLAGKKEIWLPDVRVSPTEHNFYIGGHVFDMVPGFYENYVITLDYASLYPRTMQAHNLCASTLVMAEQFARLPAAEREKVERIVCEASDKQQKIDEKEARKVEMEEKRRAKQQMSRPVQRNTLDGFFGTTPRPPTPEEELEAVERMEAQHEQHEVASRTYYFYRAEHREGLTPKILTAFLALRAEYKEKLKEARQTGDDLGAKAYDALQNATKLISNRTYGLFATNAGGSGYQGLLPCVAVAEATTAWGRTHIKETARFAVEEGPALVGCPIKLIGGDTDSVIVHVDVGVGGEEGDRRILEIGKVLAETFTRRLPPPELLEFETVHARYIYVRKKNYAATTCEVVDGKLQMVRKEGKDAKIKGLACVKSDTLPFVAETQRHMLRSVLRLPWSRTDKALLPSKLFTLNERDYLPYERIAENVLRNLMAQNMTREQLQKTIRLSKPVAEGQGPQYDVARWMLAHPVEGRMPPQQYDSVSFVYAHVERQVRAVPADDFGAVPLAIEKYVELLRSAVMTLAVVDAELPRKWLEMVRKAPRSVPVSGRARKFLKL